MMEPAVAVIVPVYNKSKYFAHCVESILNQSYRKIAVYLVDDGSTDGSGAVCDAYERRDSRVRVIHKQNEGPMKTALRGAMESTEPYVMFVDSDDWIEPEMISEMVRHLTGSCSEVVCCGLQIDREWNGTSVQEDNAASPGTYTGERLQKEIRERILGNEHRLILVSRCVKLFSRQLILNNARWCDASIRMGDDLNVVIPALLDAERIVIMDHAFYYHYIYDQASLVHSYDPGMYQNMVRLREIIGEFLREKMVPDADRMADREFLVLLFSVMKNELRSGQQDQAERIRAICKGSHIRDLIRQTGFKAADPVNRLLLFMMRRPDVVRVWFVRSIFRLRDRIAGHSQGK